MKYKVGDKLKVVGNRNHHKFEIGQIVTIGEIDRGYYKCYGELGECWMLLEKDLEPITNTIEVNGKKYEECNYDVYLESKDNLCIEVDGNRTYYNEIKEEFKTTIHGFIVKEIKHNILQIGCSKFSVSQIENLLNEYKEYLK